MRAKNGKGRRAGKCHIARMIFPHACERADNAASGYFPISAHAQGPSRLPASLPPARLCRRRAHAGRPAAVLSGAHAHATRVAKPCPAQACGLPPRGGRGAHGTRGGVRILKSARCGLLGPYANLLFCKASRESDGGGIDKCGNLW
jgi:hypothetical protein